MSCAKMNGGGAAEWGSAVYGEPNQQHAVAGSNVIATNNVDGNSMTGGADPIVDNNNGGGMGFRNNNNGGSWGKGGIKKLMKLMEQKKISEKSYKKVAMAGGAGVLENVAVPAILLYLNQKVVKSNGNKSVKSRPSSRKSRKSRN